MLGYMQILFLHMSTTHLYAQVHARLLSKRSTMPTRVALVSQIHHTLVSCAAVLHIFARTAG
jgi:hypothetical protein